jgi:hypothetical protein
MLSHQCVMNGNTVTKIKNNFSFPAACSVRFKFPARGQRPAVDLIWYDGGMKPPTPEELDEDGKELPAEGMMFVGDKGKILAGFHVEDPRLIPERRMRGYQVPEAPPKRRREPGETSPGMRQWLAACRGGKQSPGCFLNAGPISEAMNLYAVALRTGRRLKYDAEAVKITNLPEANQYLSREYRKGWELGV